MIENIKETKAASETNCCNAPSLNIVARGFRGNKYVHLVSSWAQ